MKKTLSVLLIILIVSWEVQSQSWSEVIKAIASDAATGDQFGHSVSIYGDYAIVGAVLDDKDELGNNIKVNAGSAYILKKENGIWVENQKIEPLDRAADDYFGYSVSMNGDYVIVGALFQTKDASSGAAYIFKRGVDGIWKQTQKIRASDKDVRDNFGTSVSIAGDYAIVGAQLEDENAFGGNTKNDAGSAYIFKRGTDEVWVEQQKIVPTDRGIGDHFGYSVSIDGNYIAVGCPQNDFDGLGDNMKDNAGAAYIFKQTNGIWTQQQKIVASDRIEFDEFGTAVSITGNYVIVGSPLDDLETDLIGKNTNAGAAYIYNQINSTWTNEKKIVAKLREEGSHFGTSVSISGNYAVVATNYDDTDATGNDAKTDAGSAYIFKNDNTNWVLDQKIVGSGRNANDLFGTSVGTSGNRIIVGAVNDDIKGSAFVFENTLITELADVSLTKDIYVVKVFNIQGKEIEIENATNGLFIFKYSDGSARKIYNR